MLHVDKLYIDLAETILVDGFRYSDKTRDNVELIQIPHYTLNFDLSCGFPLVSIKRTYWRKIIAELLWMLSGSTSLDSLHENGVHIWDKDSENFKFRNQYGLGDVGRIYGPQWRSWSSPLPDGGISTVDQINRLIQGLKTDPFNRRHLVSAWNPAELDYMALPPCHWSFEVLPVKTIKSRCCGRCIPGLDKCQGTIEEIQFSLKWHQRSVDTFLGLPFDIASYATLALIIESLTGYKCTNLIGDLSNVHFYKPHVTGVLEMIDRKSKVDSSRSKLVIQKQNKLEDYKPEHFEVINYESLGPIKAELFTQTTK